MTHLKLSSLLCILFICVIHISNAQYQFESGKAEKLYQKLEGLYENADYGKILKSEKDIESMFLNKEDTLAALMYSFLAESYLMWYNDVDKSIELYKKEYELREKVQKGDYDKKNLLFNLAALQDEMGYYDETEEMFTELLKEDEKEFGRKSDEYYKSAYELADHYYNTQELDKGLPLIRQLKRIVNRNTFEESMVGKLSGEFYALSGEYRKAEKELLRALSILEENGLNPSLEYVLELNSLAQIYMDMSKLPKAEELMQEAMATLDRMQGDYTDYEGGLNNNLGQIYFQLGNYDEAERIYKDLLKSDDEMYGNDSFYYGLSCYNLGLNQLYAENFADAEEYLQKASEIFIKELGAESSDNARALNLLARLYSKTERIEEAKEMGEQSIKAYKKAYGDNNPLIAYPLFNLGNIYMIDNDLDNAEKYHAEALKLRRRILGKNHPQTAESTNQMAILKWRQKKMDEALGLFQETFDNYFTQVNTYFPILSEEEKSKFYYNKLKPTFEAFNSFIISAKSDDKTLIGKMYDYQLSTKGIIMYATNKVRESIVNSGDSVLMGKYEDWVGHKEKLAKLYSASDMDVSIRNKKIDSLNTLANDGEKELSKLSSTFASTFTNQNLTWKDIKAKLKPGEAAIEVIRFRDFKPEGSGSFTDDVFYAALIVTSETEEAPEMVMMRSGKQMETRYLSNYRNAIKYQMNENYSYKYFWQPIANRIKGVSKLYFSPDGVYNQISIYTLRNPATNNFTLDEIEIQLVTNTKDLLSFNDENEINPDRKSYLFGFPNYNMGVIDTKMKASGNYTSSMIVQAASESRGTRGVRGARGGKDDEAPAFTGGLPSGLRGNMLRYMSSNQLLALLPGTQKEVNLIDELHRDKNIEPIKIMSDEALEERVKEVDNPRTLHIATHGFFLEQAEPDGQEDQYVENPLLRSGLILAGANSYISSGVISDEKTYHEDGVLTAYEAMNLKLDDTELVVLSACETGLGEVKNGEGVFGLQRAFQIAGAEAIIMSMWSVDDDATQELMTIFYEEWLTSGNKILAFNKAQKRLKEKWKYPFYWGAFVMIGN